MTRVEEPSTEDQREDADAADRLLRSTGAPVPERREPPFLLSFYRSAVVKKWLMALSGIVLLGYVLAHLIGNLKVFLGREHINEYARWLRDLGEPALPHEVVLWLMRAVLLGAFVLHIVAAYQLTMVNRKARTTAYKSPRDYAVATYASRTMRWSGVIVLLFVIFHLLDLTFGTANPDFIEGDPYNNMIVSFRQVPVAIAYVVANLALGIHIFHGAWSMFQSLGVNNPRFNALRRSFATAFTAVIVVGNLSMPLLIVTRAYP